jgi:hypothetical protein
MKWQNKLDVREMNHLRYATKGRMTIRDFKASREAQHKMSPDKEMCWDCKNIAVKLGIESK